MEKIFAKHYSTKNYIKNYQNSTIRKLDKKCAKNLSRLFTKEETWMSNEHVKKMFNVVSYKENAH